MTEQESFTADEARRIGEEIGIDWGTAPFDVEQFRLGMDVELEHGLHDLSTNVTDSDPVVTGKIALAHLNEFADYYTRLARMEDDAEVVGRMTTCPTVWPGSTLVTTQVSPWSSSYGALSRTDTAVPLPATTNVPHGAYGLPSRTR